MNETNFIIERPFPNEHAARLRDPRDFDPDTFRRTQGGTIFGKIKVPASIGIIWGKLKGKAKPGDSPHPQSLRFPISKWTVESAKRWLRDNNVKFILFEPASKEKTMNNEIERTIIGQELYRDFTFNREDANVDERTIAIAFSSETEVERWFGIEILDHQKSSVRLSRLNDGGALLLNHDPNMQIGVVMRNTARIDDDKIGRAIVKFSRSELGEEIFRDVLDGIREKASIGYRVHNLVLEEKQDNEVAKYRAMDWEPLEISIVPIPADASVGIGRDFNQRTTDAQIKQGDPIMDDEVKMATEGAVAAERKRVADLKALANQHAQRVDNMGELENKAVKEGWTPEQFGREILARISNNKAVEFDESSNKRGDEIGLTLKDIRRYSIVRAIRSLADGRKLDGIEREASDQVEHQVGRSPQGFFIPFDVLRAPFSISRALDIARMHGGQRVLQAGVAASGGFLVPSELDMGSMIEMLRAEQVLIRNGARVLGGLVGNIAIPKVTGGATAYWLPETSTVTGSDQAFGQLGLTPHRLVGDTAFTRSLVAQTSLDVEAFVRSDIAIVLAIARDKAGLEGSGASGEPLGVKNLTGVNSITFGGTATWAKVVQFETEVATDNALRGSLAYITTPAVRGKWKTTVKVANTAAFLWEDNEVNGYPGDITTVITGDAVFFGNWSELIIAEWAGIDVVVDPLSLKKSNQIEVMVQMLTDIGARHAESFSVSTDSGAQ